MTQKERDRLVALKKAKKGLITQQQAAEEIGVSERQVRRMLVALKARGDKAVIHAGRGRVSNRKLKESVRQQAIEILSQPVYAGFGPTLAAEHLRKKHHLVVGRETLRGWMAAAKLWRPKSRTSEKAHLWRQRRSCRGELVQWDTSEHDWLEGRGERLYLIGMIDDATSHFTARFVRHDSTEENMRLLWSYLETNGRPVAFYTDKASLFQTAPKVARDRQPVRGEPGDPPPTQIARALHELGIAWIAAHSPQAKGRIERSFHTAQDRLVKELRVAGVSTLEQANAYLETHFLPWWNQHLAVTPANPTDAHRKLANSPELAAVLSRVETRQVTSDYTISFENQLYQIPRKHVCAGLRGSTVRVEKRLDGTIALRFKERYVDLSPCQKQPKAVPVKAPPKDNTSRPRTPSAAMQASMRGFLDKPTLPVWKAGQINRTRTTDQID